MKKVTFCVGTDGQLSVSFFQSLN